MLNKADAVDDERRRELAFRHPDAVLVSALTGEDLDGLGERIAAEFERTLRDVELLVPFSEGGTLSELHDVAGDLEREDTPGGVRVSARLPDVVAERFDRYAVDGARNGRPARRRGSAPAGGAEAGLAALRVRQRVHDLQLRRPVGHEQELRDAVAGRDGERLGPRCGGRRAPRRGSSGRSGPGAFRHVMPCSAARPERGVTRPATPGGSASASPVATACRPPGGSTTASTLRRS